MPAFQAGRQRFKFAILHPEREIILLSSAVERTTVNRLVPGSIPGGGVNYLGIMKVVNDVLSDSLYKKCSDAIQNSLSHQKWGSSNLSWCDDLVKGLGGSCLSTIVPVDLQYEIEEQIRPKLPCARYFIVQFYVWQALSGIMWHNDKEHKFGATIYLNKNWNINDGGIFLYQNNESNTLTGLIPKKNTMVLNDQHEFHMVTPISLNTNEPRLTLQIWGH